MQKFISRSLSAILVLALVLSMSAVAFAATTTYTVTMLASETDQTQLSEVPQIHQKGTATSIAYSVLSKTYSFNSAVFPSEHRSNLLLKYVEAGFVKTLTIKGESGYKTVAASLPSGTYAVVLNYLNGSGLWAINSSNGDTLDEGYFDNAPISYEIKAVRVM